MKAPAASAPGVFYRSNLVGLRDEPLSICPTVLKCVLSWTLLPEYLKTINRLIPRWVGCIVSKPSNR